ncbi:MAG: helix-turn-helix domain-containing protein [Armatimonadetes bacterium]|nr:helix-turn-helix domain-containing protein [Armatimonadota bacterium]
MKIDVIALNGVFDTGLAAVLDAFQTANDLTVPLGLSSVSFDVTVVGLRRQVHTGQGFKIPVTRADGRTPPDWVIVPAIGQRAPEPLAAALSTPEVRDAVRLLRKWGDQGVNLAAACIGTFIAAESGLLNGEAATTTWWLAPYFHQRYPLVRLQSGRMLVHSGRVLTAGAALSHMDMALWLIRQASLVLAETTARYLIVDSRPAQSAYAISNHLVHSDPLVQKYEEWARGHLASGFSLQAAASEVGVSKRTLERRLRAVLGKSPLSYFQDLRIEHAVHVLRTSGDSMEKVAEAVGYQDSVTLRNLIKSRIGRGIREIRAERIDGGESA